MSLNPKIKSLFETLEPHEFITDRKVSKETVTDDGEKKPLIELQPSNDNTKLILKFIRSKKPVYTLNDLMAGFFCYAKDNGLANLEFLSCIPGSIGGAIKMNSGCYNNDISKVLLSIQAIDLNKFSEVNIEREDIKFLYRGILFNFDDNGIKSA